MEDIGVSLTPSTKPRCV